MKKLLESWDRFLNEENNAEKLYKSNEVREFINSLPYEISFSEIRSAIFDKFIDYPDVKDVTVYEAGRAYEGSRPSVIITFEEGKGIPPFDESLSVSFDFEEPDDEERLDEKKKKKKEKKKAKKDACYNKVKSRYKVWPSAYASGALVKCRKVGAANWGNKSKKNENVDLEESEPLEEKKEKAGTESSKESSLKDWFGRKGAKGKSKGWVDCNSPDGDGGYKSCGRKEGEKRSKYPACRPTPGACKEKGKGKSWGKKAKKESLTMTKNELSKIITEEVETFLNMQEAEQKSYEVDAIDENEEYCPVCADTMDEAKKKKACKPSKGKRFAKRVDGKCRSFGQAGQAKSGGDRIRPGTKKGDAYCARSAGIKKCKNPPCANTLSRKKWKCRGKKSMKE